jgi:hypothetical protein
VPPPSQPNPLSNMDEDPVEYGIQLTVKYDNKILFSNARWFQKLGRLVINKLIQIETNEVDRASIAKGRTKHRNGL